MRPDRRLGALRRFAVAITALNLLGHTALGFEQSWAQLFAALLTAYACELGFEVVDARAKRRPPAFLGGLRSFVDYMLPSHITGLAVGMLLYAGDRVLPFVFAAAVAVASKMIFRAPVGAGRRHFFNPSNAGITGTLVLFPTIGIAPPYQFVENVSGAVDWILPGLLIIAGSFIHIRFAGRMTLVLAWLSAFAVQAVIRAIVFGTPLLAGLMPMTGLAFLLFTFYMIPDPGTTPSDTRGQITFGVSAAAMYALLTAMHVVFQLFFALTLVCALRGLALYVRAILEARAQRTTAAAAVATASGT